MVIVRRGSPTYRMGEIIWQYLRVTDGKPAYLPGSPGDTLVLVLGSPDIRVADHAVSLLSSGVADYAVISGGCAVPGLTPVRLEADAIAERIRQLGVDGHRLIREHRSRNTSENFWYTARLLARVPVTGGGDNPPKFVALVTTPVAERRALATGRRRWPETQFWIDGIPESYDDFMDRTDHSVALSRMVGEVERILVYPALGYMTEPDSPPPPEVLAAYELLREEFSGRAIPSGLVG